MTLSATLAEFASGFSLAAAPPEVVAKARACFLNGYGMAIGGSNTPYAPVARDAALAMDGERADGATIFGDGRRTTIGGATLANAALSHGRAQEDACGACHIGAVVLPLLTGMAEARRIDSRRMFEAAIVAYEVAGLFERAYATQTVPRGFRSSPIYGVLGAAAGAGRMLGLDAGRMQAALANAVAFAGGGIQSFVDGTDAWRYQVGETGRTALTAASLAAAGSVSAPHAFEGPAGFVRNFVGTECDVEALSGRIGRDWSILAVAFKPFPVCAFNQTPVTAALGLREQLGGRPLARVKVHMNPFECHYAGMDARGPFDSISGTLMSIPFCVATTLAHGAPTMAAMTAYDDPAVAALIDKVELKPDESVSILSCLIEADLADGLRLVQNQPMTAADYSYDLDGVSALIRRVGAETDVPERAFARLERFATALPDADLGDVLAAFAEMPPIGRS